MRVVAYDPFVTLERFRELGVESAPTPEAVYAKSDVITLHLPLNEQTKGILGAAAFAQMRDGVLIVNAARGGLIDEDALGDALRSGKVGGAALDVFESEPYSGPLLELEQVVLTPHLAGSTTEAQDRAGLIIAEQVAAALDGELVQTAVNIPVVEQADLEVLGPFIPLAARLGRLATALVSARPERIVVAAHGPLSEYDTRLLTVAALNGVFQDRVDQTVNYVNAPVIAAERGLDVSEQRFAASQHYTNLVRVVVSGPGEQGPEEIEVSGTTIGPEARLFLAGALGFAIDIELAPRMAFLVYDDVPGVIGRVGTMFGEAGVNIANMAVSRTKEGGKALMAFSIDSAPPRELVERVDASGFDAAHFIVLAQPVAH
jgi:D-3-phosphoglycerate dehydrogenase